MVSGAKKNKTWGHEDLNLCSARDELTEVCVWLFAAGLPRWCLCSWSASEPQRKRESKSSRISLWTGFQTHHETHKARFLCFCGSGNWTGSRSLCEHTKIQTPHECCPKHHLGNASRWFWSGMVRIFSGLVSVQNVCKLWCSSLCQQKHHQDLKMRKFCRPTPKHKEPSEKVEKKNICTCKVICWGEGGNPALVKCRQFWPTQRSSNWRNRTGLLISRASTTKITRSNVKSWGQADPEPNLFPLRANKLSSSFKLFPRQFLQGFLRVTQRWKYWRALRV